MNQMDDIQPCPFCGEGKTQIRETTFWTGMRNDIVSVTVMHWCHREEGQPQSVVQMAGRDRESAVALWNNRSNT